MCEVTPELLTFLKQWEGVRLTVYRDVGGLLTVGCGHLVQPQDRLKLGVRISNTQVDEFLRADLYAALTAVNRLVTVQLTPGQCMALTSFVFNLGLGAFKRSTLLVYLNDGKTESAADEFSRFRTVRGKVIAGLVNRRAAERALFLQVE